MSNFQPGILAPVPKHARYLVFSLEPNSDPRSALKALGEIVEGDKSIVGVGQSLVAAMGREITGLRTFPALVGAGFEIPSTPAALWCWLRGNDRGELLHRSRNIEQTLMPDFILDDVLDAFMYGASRDLTGYEDGTENPKGNDAIEAAFVSGQGPGMDGSSFVAVQQWLHDLDLFEAMSPEQQDNTIGRRKSDNEELDEAPESAHVKRTAQESFNPEAFVLRRSMPWAEDTEAGLNFVAFGKSYDAFEALLNRMIGNEDGISDAMFTFTRPVTGSYFWCPPVKDGKLDFSALDL
ncbi:MAG: peroxidase [Gammaproteobacteria bacterium SG8_11]|nr:MAG: peroxidase [Gammaproteobacteria bacterium SG8_11]